MKRTSIHTSEGSKKAKRGRYGCLESLELEQTADGRQQTAEAEDSMLFFIGVWERRCLGKGEKAMEQKRRPRDKIFRVPYLVRTLSSGKSALIGPSLPVIQPKPR